MIRDFADGYRFGLSGLGRLLEPRLRAFVFVPMLLNAGIFAIGTWWLYQYLDTAHQAIVEWLTDWLDWLVWLFWLFALAALLIVVWSTFTVVANLIGSPFNGLLAERVQRVARPDVAFPQLSLATEVVRAPLAELSKLGYFVVLAIPVLLIVLLPGINVLAPLAWTIYGSWLLAVEYCDYPLSNMGVRLPEQRRILRSQRWLALGFGAGVMTMTVIPGLNLVAMPSAVIGASRLWAERLAETGGKL
jgi:CysZ protein